MGECAHVHERLPQRSHYRFPSTCWHFHNCSKSYFESAQVWSCGIVLVCLLFQMSAAWNEGSFFWIKFVFQSLKASAASSISLGADLEDGQCSGRLHHTNDSKAVPKLTSVVLGESASSSDRHRDSLLLEHTSLARPPGLSDTLLLQSSSLEKPCFQYGEPNPIRGEPLEC